MTGIIPISASVPRGPRGILGWFTSSCRALPLVSGLIVAFLTRLCLGQRSALRWCTFRDPEPPGPRRAPTRSRCRKPARAAAIAAAASPNITPAGTARNDAAGTSPRAWASYERALASAVRSHCPRGTIDRHSLAVMQASSGIACCQDGWNAVLSRDNRRVGEDAAAVGHEGSSLREQHGPRGRRDRTDEDFSRSQSPKLRLVSDDTDDARVASGGAGYPSYHVVGAGSGRHDHQIHHRNGDICGIPKRARQGAAVGRWSWVLAVGGRAWVGDNPSTL